MHDELKLQGTTRIHRTDIPMKTDDEDIPPYNSPENKKILNSNQLGHCWLCFGEYLPKDLTIDHIIPRSKGGTDHLKNLQLLCANCNSIKGSGTMEDAIVKRQKIDKNWAKKKEAILAEVQAGFGN